MADWKARFAAVAERLPPLDEIDPRFRIPAWVNVTELRKLFCATLASDDWNTDERIERLMKERDPILVLKLVAPYVPITEVEPVPETATPVEPEPNLPVDLGGGGGGGTTFTDHGTTTEVVDKFAPTQAKADAIAKETGGEVKGYD